MNIIQNDVLIIFIVLLGIIAFLYTSVGHGGASGYLALMALFSFPVYTMKPTALLLNIFASAISFWFFKKNHFFNWKLFYPFAVTSIPMSFLGGYISVNNTLYKYILAGFLIIAMLRMLNLFGRKENELKKINIPLALILGGIIGIFSGMIGIGGGIILSPVIILLGWGNIKQAAAVSAIFILVNSISGMFGFILKGGIIPVESSYFVPVVLVFGSLGAMYGSKKFNGITLKYILAGVLSLACIKLFLI